MNRRTHYPVIVLLMVLTMLGQNIHAELQAFVDRSTILESQTIELTLRSSSQGDPDFSVLEEQFNILGTRTNSQYQSVNGRVSSWIDWSLTLEPKSTGKITIPALSLNSETSEPIIIQVNALDPELRTAIQSLVFFETGISAESVYVQAQLLFTRKLYYARGAQLYGETPGVPEIENAVVATIGPSAPVSIDLNGRSYTMIEQKFAIYPEQSGQMTIPAAAASGNVRLRPQPGFVGGRTRIRAVSEALNITVKPIPAHYPASQPWLPASEVNIVDAWSDHSDSLVVGLPVTRVLKVQSQATIGAIIPPLKPDFPIAIRAYPQAPEISEQVTPSGLSGLRKESYSIAAQRSGSIDLPKISLTWWDTDTDEVKVATVPAISLAVALNPDAPDTLMQDEIAVPEEPISGDTEPQLPDEQTLEPEPAEALIPKIWIALLLVLVVVAVVIKRFRIHEKLIALFGNQFRRYAGVGTDAARERKLFKTLQSGEYNDDPLLFKNGITEWLSLYYHLPTHQALILLDRDEQSHQLLASLNRSIYASTASPEDQAKITKEILKLLGDHRRNSLIPGNTDKRQSTNLPELFPIGTH